jgi:hypothetical protein
VISFVGFGSGYIFRVPLNHTAEAKTLRQVAQLYPYASQMSEGSGEG